MKKAKSVSVAGKEDTPYSKFERLAKALIAVPKSEIDKRQAEYEKKKAAKKRRAA